MPQRSATHQSIKPELQQILKSFESEILANWEREALRSLPPAAALSPLALRNSFPQIIDSLAEALVDISSKSRIKNVSSIHAHERAFLTTYSIEQVIIEYLVLRDVVTSTLEREIELTQVERRKIQRIFDEGVLHSAREFYRVKSATDLVTRAESLLVANRLHALQMITEVALTYASDIDRLMTEILSMVRQTLSAETSAILLLTDAGKNLFVRAAQGIEKEVDPNLRIPATKGVAGRALELLHPVIVPDLTHVETASPALKPAGVKSLMVVPLKIENRPIGVIQVGTLKQREFSIDEQAHFQIVADRIAIAIDHARLYAQIQQDKEILEQERLLRKRFVAALTHDLKSPLTSVLTGLGLLRRHPGDNQMRERLFSQMQKSLIRMNEMIEDMLDVDRIQAGHSIPIEIENFDLATLVEDVRQEFLTTQRRELKVSCPNSLVCYCWPRGIRRILDNLLTNALKYGAPEAPVSLSVSRQKDQMLLSVHNEGNPLSETELETLNDPPEQIKSSAKASLKGWGIGLPLVRGIAEAHGGQVKIKSSKDEGTTFTVILPVDCRKS